MLKDDLERFVDDFVGSYQAKTRWKPPIVAFADALKEIGLDKHACYQVLLENEKVHKDLGPAI